MKIVQVSAATRIDESTKLAHGETRGLKPKLSAMFYKRRKEEAVLYFAGAIPLCGLTGTALFFDRVRLRLLRTARRHQG
jgi:hypothetical protein